MLFHTAHTHTFSSFLLCQISYNKTICLPLWWDALAGDKLCWTTPTFIRFMNCVKRIFNCRAQKHFLLQRSHKMRWIFGSGIFPFGTVRKWTMHGQLSSGSVFVYFRMQCAMEKNFHSKWMGFCFFFAFSKWDRREEQSTSSRWSFYPKMCIFSYKIC